MGKGKRHQSPASISGEVLVMRYKFGKPPLGRKFHSSANDRQLVFLNLGYFQSVLAPGRWYRQKEFLPARSITVEGYSYEHPTTRISPYRAQFTYALHDLRLAGLVERKLRTKKTYEYRLTKAGLVLYLQAHDLKVKRK